MDLPPLPINWDEGYDWMQRLTGGWTAVPSWGEDGWDLGSWPYVIVCWIVKPIEQLYGMAIYVEGDTEVQQFDDVKSLIEAIDATAEFYWRHGQNYPPTDLPEGSGLLPRHKGPYWSRKKYLED